MGKFKVGQRVAVYTASYGRTTHTITSVQPGIISLSGSSPPEYAHPNQCRRLKPKAKLKEFWVYEPDWGHKEVNVNTKDEIDEDHVWIHFREVRKK